jgi:hypothetical protein
MAGSSGKVLHLVAQQLFDLSADLSGLDGRDTEFKLSADTSDEFAHGGGPRNTPKPVLQPPGYVRSGLHIDTLKVQAGFFIDFQTGNRQVAGSNWFKARVPRKPVLDDRKFNGVKPIHGFLHQKMGGDASPFTRGHALKTSPKAN